jgi:hypothetical protein
MRLDQDFPVSVRVVSAEPRREIRYDGLVGVERLAALEQALQSARSSWSDDPAEAASSWIREHTLSILADLEIAPDSGASYPNVWERFGWSHSPDNAGDQDGVNQAAINRALCLVVGLPSPVLRSAIEGLAHWAYTWSTYLASHAEVLVFWQRLWPVAVEATNSRSAPCAEGELESVVRPDSTTRSVEMDTLNSTVGKIIQVFLKACPRLELSPAPFADDPCRTMRDEIVAADGDAGWISRYRLIEFIGYFLSADPDWTHQWLLQPLRSESLEALQLWQALAHRILSRDVLRVIGNSMAERAVDTRLDRETRQGLITNLVVDSLYSIMEKQEPAVARARLQQTLRAVDDEVRAHAADTVYRFVSDLSSTKDAGHLLRDVAGPFLRKVWPQEQTLTTPGVSRAFARLPAVSGSAFADAVAAVERFLVPFDCWSLSDYGLYGLDEDGSRLATINSAATGHALLTLLDSTIRTNEGAVIPDGLSEALEQIRTVAPLTVTMPQFRRLATAARRM